MDILTTADELAQWRRTGQGTVGLVPTMGNLHAGHMALVDTAAARCDRVIVSVFVNPLQFGPDEDLDSYPRTFDADRDALANKRVDAIFAPSVEQIYPNGMTHQTTVRVMGVSEILCGSRRPAHFKGVATIVTKLFNLVRPDAAFFGEKDYQQLMVIRRMVEDLCMGVEIVGVPTVREADGLARSSRNQYLTANERRQAASLSAALRDCAEQLAAGHRDFRSLEARGWARLVDAGFDPDYFEIRGADLAPAEPAMKRFRVLAAAHIGRARLIDNIGV
ncbi:pantoate--beta-alanine ligase [Salinisphaera sp. T31B1]|uniref:pantoate--beta-alanine ligase n=1 Tax=Salinisphaera sp. T31B1 TaxID=727963 RepID=UPI003341FBCD